MLLAPVAATVLPPDAVAVTKIDDEGPKKFETLFVIAVEISDAIVYDVTVIAVSVLEASADISYVPLPPPPVVDPLP